MATATRNLLDPDDGLALRVFYESLRAQMVTDRASQDAKWHQLEDFFAPGTARWDTSQANRGERKDQAIINETGLLALRTLKAGMLTGMSSQTRPWFKIGADRDDLNAKAPVRQWCEDAEAIVRKVFLKSNFYETLLTCYGEEALFGTSAFMLLDDEKTTIRCHPWPIGSYYLGCDDDLRIDLGVRILTMTVRQIVERFGRVNVSDAVLALYDSPTGGQKETRYPIVHVVHRGSYFAQSGKNPPMPWVSIYYELGPYNDKTGILSRQGFIENPLVVGRWNVVGENVWGKGAGDDCLGSTMSLQSWEEILAEAAERQIKPPMIAGSEIDPRKYTTLPGDVVFSDGKDVSNALKPLYQFDFKLEGGVRLLERIEKRIDDAMYRTLFQMFSESDRRDITAEEIRARASEKMQVLGPVVERNVGEVLGPAVVRTISICERRALLPPLPAEMKGQRFKLEFISILAQAQKMSAVSNVTQYLSILGTEVAVDQGILDNVDLDEAARYVADNLSVPTKMLRTPEQVAAIRSDRARQQQQAQAADNAQKLAAAAQNLSNAKTGQGSLLDSALPALAGGGEA